MIVQENLQVYDVALNTSSPLFIGSGRECTKKEYAFNPVTKKVSFIDSRKFMEFLIRENLLDEYENYILNRPQDYLFRFLQDCRVSKSEMDAMTLYTADGGDALEKDRSLAEIKQFIRDSRGRVYVPGSSLKGSLRTVILIKMIREKPYGKTLDPIAKGRDIEQQYLNTLKLNGKKPLGEVNSIMRGISVSDSEPLPLDCMVLCRKHDISVLGNKKSINTIRECVKPGVEIHFKLTLDASAAGGIRMDFIKKAIAEYGEYYKQTYIPRFRLPEDAASESFENSIVLGGGSGYFGKNIVYPILGRDAGVRYVSGIMQRKFPKHYHEKDIAGGISPHTLKHTAYRAKSWHFGICRIDIR